MTQDPARSIPAQTLNIFSPRKPVDKNVLIFIHGGSWRSGDKKLYSFFGNRMARKGVVTVVIGYPLSPVGDYNDMAYASAISVKWVYENIERFGGDPDKIFISGHSAGGHLAALISVRGQYLDSVGMKSSIKGAILIDCCRTRYVRIFDGGEKTRRAFVFENIYTESKGMEKSFSPISFA
jgi:acetyl esterase/lipase